MHCNYGQQSFVVAIKSVKCHICFAKQILIENGLRNSRLGVIKILFFIMREVTVCTDTRYFEISIKI